MCWTMCAGSCIYSDINKFKGEVNALAFAARLVWCAGPSVQFDIL